MVLFIAPVRPAQPEPVIVPQCIMIVSMFLGTRAGGARILETSENRK